MGELYFKFQWKLIVAAILVFIGCLLIGLTFFIPNMNWWQIILYVMGCVLYVGYAESVCAWIMESPNKRSTGIKWLYDLLEAGWIIEIGPQPKRMDGEWHCRYVWRAERDGKGLWCEWKGFATSKEAMLDLKKTLQKEESSHEENDN